jgi:hypothetical protein
MDAYYILDGTEPVAVDLLTWGRWFETADRHVAATTLADGTYVSTGFLGLDHQWGDGPPLLFETMVFDPSGESQDCWRSATWHQAEQGHQAVVAALQPAADPPPP